LNNKGKKVQKNGTTTIENETLTWRCIGKFVITPKEKWSAQRLQ
jgi:hypothetical protein